LVPRFGAYSTDSLGTDDAESYADRLFLAYLNQDLATKLGINKQKGRSLGISSRDLDQNIKVLAGTRVISRGQTIGGGRDVYSVAGQRRVLLPACSCAFDISGLSLAICSC
jgi:hypothetical protein